MTVSYYFGDQKRDPNLETCPRGTGRKDLSGEPSQVPSNGCLFVPRWKSLTPRYEVVATRPEP